MDVSAIVSRISAQCPTFAQVIEPSTGGSYTPIDTQANLYTLFTSIVDDNLWPVHITRENPTHPSLVYTLTGASPGVFDGYDVTHTDLFVMNLRGADYDVLLTKYDAIVAALAGQQIEITDQLHDYDQSENLFRINIELTYTYLAAAAQTLPVAFVYPIQRVGLESAYDNFTKQRIDAEYAILIITADGNLVALQDELQAALVGWQQTVNHHETEYATGVSVEGVGGLEMWRETYRDAYYMTQA